MMKIFDGVISQFVNREFLLILKFLKVFAFMILCTHLAACTWFFVGHSTMDSDNGSWLSELLGHKDQDKVDEMLLFTKYSYAWYWAVVTVKYALSLSLSVSLCLFGC